MVTENISPEVQALNSILCQLIGIEYNSLSKAERNILNIAANALKYKIVINNETGHWALVNM